MLKPADLLRFKTELYVGNLISFPPVQPRL